MSEEFHSQSDTARLLNKPLLCYPDRLTYHTVTQITHTLPQVNAIPTIFTSIGNETETISIVMQNFILVNFVMIYIFIYIIILYLALSYLCTQLLTENNHTHIQYIHTQAPTN